MPFICCTDRFAKTTIGKALKIGVAFPQGGGNEATPLEDVSGFVPTPHGNISARFSLTRKEGKNEKGEEEEEEEDDVAFSFTSVVANITVPSSSLVGRLGMPTLGQTVKALRVNGRQEPVTSRDEDFVYVTLQGTGVFAVQLDYGDNAEKNTSARGVLVEEEEEEGEEVEGHGPLPWVYSGTFVGNDTATRGNWRTTDGQPKYGKLGYNLFHFDAVGSNLTHVTPEVMARIEIFHQSLSGARPVHWSVPEKTDERALLDPRNASGTRKLGAWASFNPQACHQSIVLDVTLPLVNASSPRRVSLYFVDWQRTGSVFAIEMRELKSLELAAPTQAVTDVGVTGGGVYMTFLVTTSVRFRIMEITGAYPRSDADVFVSGIFFD